MILKNNLKKYRFLSLFLMGFMVIGLYGLAFLKPQKKTVPSHVLKGLSSRSSFHSLEILNKTKIFKETRPSKNQSLDAGKESLRAPIEVSFDRVEDLLSIFHSCDYSVSKVRLGICAVPRILVTQLPSDIEKQKQNRRKEAFILSLLPMILQTNEKIMENRQRLLTLLEKRFLSPEEKQWLKTLASHYRLKTIDEEELKKRVDTIPPSLFLAQAIIETGWGTSWAALQKKSLFGITLASGSVKAYESLQESIEAYIHNLNYNGAYKEMRTLRARMRQKGESLCSHRLMDTLLFYCEKRQWYIKKVQGMIQKLQLKQFDVSELV